MSEKSSSGYVGVRMKGTRYAAEKGGVTIGTYDTAVEAAVAYAQHVGEAPPTAPKAPRPNVQKQHEGVTLFLSPQSATGYLGVLEASPGRFLAQYKQERLGIYDDVLDAAVAYARHVQKAVEEAEAAERAAAAEKGIAAEAEGLRLHIDMKGSNSTGYLGVSTEQRGGKYLARYANKNLGVYDTALEAAVAYARGRKEEEDAARALLEGEEDDDGPKGEAELAAERLVAETGLKLFLSAQSSTGYLGVTRSSASKGGQYWARHTSHTIGRYASLIEAAVAYAQYREQIDGDDSQEAKAKAASKAAAEKLVKDTGLKLWTSKACRSGYLGVQVHESRGRNGAPPETKYSAQHHTNRLGLFHSAIEAAVAYAQHRLEIDKPKEAEAAAKAKAKAAAEKLVARTGLKLFKSSMNATGYLGVQPQAERFVASLKDHRIGVFDSAIEAAVAYAKYKQKDEAKQLEAERAVQAELRKAAAARGLTTEVDGLQLLLSPTSNTGYLGVVESSGGRFTARHGNDKLGIFNTVLEAAVAYARAYARHRNGVDDAGAAEAAAAEADEAEAAAAPAAAEEEVEAVEEEEAAAEPKAKKAKKGKAPSKAGKAAAAAAAKAAAEEEAEEAAAAMAAEAAAEAAAAACTPSSSTSAVVAESEGIALHLGVNGSTGYVGVTAQRGRFLARYRSKSLGAFDTAVEAAVAYARAAGPPVGSEEGKAQKEAEAAAAAAREAALAAQLQAEVLDVDDEQLELWTSKTAASGYLGVCEQRGTFVARYGQTRGNDNNLGTFGTAREAAVAYARARLKAEAAGRAAILELERSYEARGMATEVDGLKLHLSVNNVTGYTGVRPSHVQGKFKADSGGTKLGCMFDTAVDAAVAYARHLAAEKSSPPKPAKRKADEAAPAPAADGDADADGSPRIKLKFLKSSGEWSRGSRAAPAPVPVPAAVPPAADDEMAE